MGHIFANQEAQRAKKLAFHPWFFVELYLLNHFKTYNTYYQYDIPSLLGIIHAIIINTHQNDKNVFTQFHIDIEEPFYV